MRLVERLDDFVVPGIGVDVVDVERMKFALETASSSASPSGTTPVAGRPRRL
jgi:hypothetical protein